MKLNLEDVSSVEKKLTVMIGKEKVTNDYNEILAGIVKTANIKGFRKGKAPKSIIEGTYGPKIQEDLVTKLVSDSYQQALKLKELAPISQPSISMEPFKKGEDFTYSMNIELMPVFEVADFSGLELTNKKPEVTDSDVDDTINNLKEQHAIFKETAEDKKAGTDDMVIFDYKGFLPDGSLIKDGEKENFSVVIGSKQLIPGFEDNMIGLSKGDEKEFTVTFPKDYFEKDYTSKDVRFEVKVSDIKEKEIPELNDDFAKNFGEYNTIGELKEFIKKQLSEEKKKQSTVNLREQIVDRLLEANAFEVPKSFIERQLDYIVHETKQRLLRQGADIKAISDADTRENSRELALKMIKRDIIIGKIVEKEGFKVEDDDLEAKYNEMAGSVGQPVQAVKDHYKKVNAEQALRDDILIQKVFDKITDTANIKEI